MSEGGNSRKDGKSGSPKVVRSRKSEVRSRTKKTIPRNSEINKSESTNPPPTAPDSYRDSKLQTEIMEVHHHPEVEKKGFKQYLLEGLMIFIAVTMGFFAESLREHISDKERADEQAHSFYAELKSDSGVAALAIKNWDRKNQALYYMKKYFEADSSLVSCSKAFSLNFYYAFRINSPSRFEPRTVILEQLKKLRLTALF